MTEAEWYVPETTFEGVDPVYVDEMPDEPNFTIEENSERLTGNFSETPNGDNPEVAVVERLVLSKFDGDLTEEEMTAAQPRERIVVQRGKVTEHYIRR